MQQSFIEGAIYESHDRCSTGFYHGKASRCTASSMVYHVHLRVHPTTPSFVVSVVSVPRVERSFMEFGMETSTYLTYQSPLGTIYLVASPQGLLGVYLEDFLIPLGCIEGDHTILRLAKSELEAYFLGNLQNFSVHLDHKLSKGSELQKAVWLELGKIPYGHTVSYSQIAENLDRPKTVRAVGRSVGRNPWFIEGQMVTNYGKY